MRTAACKAPLFPLKSCTACITICQVLPFDRLSPNPPFSLFSPWKGTGRTGESQNPWETTSGFPPNIPRNSCSFAEHDPPRQNPAISDETAAKARFGTSGGCETLRRFDPFPLFPCPYCSGIYINNCLYSAEKPPFCTRLQHGLFLYSPIPYALRRLCHYEIYL